MPKRSGRDSSRRSEPLVDKRQEYVLIVCEGQKTEPQYFEDLREKYQLGIVNIEITPAEGSDPLSVVRTAKSRQDSKKKKRKKPFDRVYCVFDRDKHPRFDEASQQIAALQGQGFRSARSWPCFEFWLLLHFRYTRQPFERDGSRTAAQNCENALKSKIKEYRKGKRGMFDELLPRLEEAKGNAARALKDAESTGENNPSTEVHELVGYLQNLNGIRNASL
uniref:RloB-like protein n=1 Tax=Candidatus Kentrum sp. LFY TaxID=2126342 RepID=A0A450V3C1_9GAMM|nr:MAG: RloB-like protein [Candidatus Kentron sp. LFY]